MSAVMIEIDSTLNSWILELSKAEQHKVVNQILYTYWESRNLVVIDSTQHIPKVSPILHSNLQLIESKVDTLQATHQTLSQGFHKLSKFLL